MTYQEIVDDALGDVHAFGNFASLTQSEKLRFVSEAIHKLQKKAKVMKSTTTIDTSSLDSSGAIALDKSITVPVRVMFTPTGSTGIIEVTPISPDVMARMKTFPTQWSPWPAAIPGAQKLYVSLEQSKLWFWPFQGLNGTYTLTSYTKMPIYALSLAADATSYWYGWDADHIAAKMASTHIPQEMDDATEEITMYVAAKLLTLIPGWRQRFANDYAERMARFESIAEDVRANAPEYPLNYKPQAFYGW